MPNRSAISGVSTLELTLAAVLIAGVIGLVTAYLRNVLPALERKAIISFSLENALVSKPNLGVSVGVPIEIGINPAATISSPRTLFPIDLRNDSAVKELFLRELEGLGRSPSSAGNDVRSEWCVVLLDPSQASLDSACSLVPDHIVSSTLGLEQCRASDALPCINQAARWILASRGCMADEVSPYELPLLVAMVPIGAGLDPTEACAVREIAAPWMAQ